MRSLQRVVVPPSYLDRYTAIVNSKRDAVVRQHLQNLTAQISARFIVFEGAVVNQQLHSIAEDNILQRSRTELLSCYKNKGKGIRRIFEEIKSAQNSRILERCPYCGITLPKTHDHYLPEERFPEFAAHALNLVPCCSDCNSTKGSRWINGNGRMFIHFYSDPIPQIQYLHVNIMTSPGTLAVGAQFFIHRPVTGIPNAQWSLIESHFEELGLLQKYQDMVNHETSAVFDICVEHVRNGGAGVTAFLNGIATRNAQVFGVNHWRVVLWNALAVDANFIALVNQSV